MSKDINLDEFEKYLSTISSDLEINLSKKIQLCCQKVRSDIVESMAKTPRDSKKSYYTNNKNIPHHPSLPGNPPAPDTGNLRNSIRYEVHKEGKRIYGVVGSTQKDPDYASYTEYGTSKMKPRPWLRPAMQKNNNWIRNILKNSVEVTLKEGEK